MSALSRRAITLPTAVTKTTGSALFNLTQAASYLRDGRHSNQERHAAVCYCRAVFCTLYLFECSPSVNIISNLISAQNIHRKLATNQHIYLKSVPSKFCCRRLMASCGRVAGVAPPCAGIVGRGPAGAPRPRRRHCFLPRALRRRPDRRRGCCGRQRGAHDPTL